MPSPAPDKNLDDAASGSESPAVHANLVSLAEVHAFQVMILTGRQPNPNTGKAEKNLELARYNVEMLEVILDKTEGNRTEEETESIERCLHIARMAYVEAAAGE